MSFFKTISYSDKNYVVNRTCSVLTEKIFYPSSADFCNFVGNNIFQL